MHSVNLNYFPYQNAVRHLNSKVKALVGGYGAGKTRFICQRAIEFCALNQGLYGMIVSPSMSQGLKTIVVTMQEICEELSIPFEYKKSHAPYFKIFDTTIWLTSGNKPESLKGPTLGWAAIDEPFIQERETYNISLSRLRDKKSNMLELCLAGTPEELNWGYDLLEKNVSEKVGYVRVSSRMNPALPEESIELLEDQYDDKMIEAYIDGRFVQLNTSIAYYAFFSGAGGNVDNDVVYDPTRDLVLACDFNKDPMCWNVIQDHEYTEKNHDVESTLLEPWCIDEIHVRGTDTTECVREFIRRWGDVHKGKIYIEGDFSGTSSRDTVASFSNYDIIEETLAEKFGASKVKRRLYPNPREKMRRNLVNGKLRNSKGERHLKIHPRCQYTIDDFSKVKIKEGTDQIDKSANQSQLTHHSDAVGYHVYVVNNLERKLNKNINRRRLAA